MINYESRFRAIILFSIICFSISCFAQEKSYFNTIGKTDKMHKSIINKDNDKFIQYTNSDTIEQDSITEVSIETFKIIRPKVSLPLKAIHINSPFGKRTDPINRKSTKVHNGIDLRAKFENVYAMLPGTVVDAGSSENGGNYIKIQHGICICIYLHLSKIIVQQGQHVSAGQKVAISGNSGKRTTGPHLHISCKWSDNGKYFDPKVLLGYIAEELVKNS